MKQQYSGKQIFMMTTDMSMMMITGMVQMMQLTKWKMTGKVERYKEKEMKLCIVTAPCRV